MSLFAYLLSVLHFIQFAFFSGTLNWNYEKHQEESSLLVLYNKQNIYKLAEKRSQNFMQFSRWVLQHCVQTCTN